MEPLPRKRGLTFSSQCHVHILVPRRRLSTKEGRSQGRVLCQTGSSRSMRPCKIRLADLRGGAIFLHGLHSLSYRSREECSQIPLHRFGIGDSKIGPDDIQIESTVHLLDYGGGGAAFDFLQLLLCLCLLAFHEVLIEALKSRTRHAIIKILLTTSTRASLIVLVTVVEVWSWS